MGTGPSSPTLAKLATAPPEGARKKAFQIAGRSEALPQKKISEIDVDAIDQWVVDEYRENDDGSPTKYPAVVIGAVSGAAFFRLKRKALGPVYEEFLRDHLAEGGTVITLENTRTWRSTHTGTGASDGRSFFQFGCLGGLPEQKYVSGSQRVREFLAAEGSEYQQWTAPEATGRTPDGEWGFDLALGEGIERLAGQQGWGRRRLFQNEPQDASAVIAELYRDWYARGRGEVIGVDREAYPVDTGAAFRYQEAMKSAGEHRELPDPLSLEEVDAFAQKYGIISSDLSLPEHHDDVAGEGLRNPVAWVAD